MSMVRANLVYCTSNSGVSYDYYSLCIWGLLKAKLARLPPGRTVDISRCNIDVNQLARENVYNIALVHWSRNQTAAISQTIYPNAYPWQNKFYIDFPMVQ